VIEFEERRGGEGGETGSHASRCQTQERWLLNCRHQLSPGSPDPGIPMRARSTGATLTRSAAGPWQKTVEPPCSDTTGSGAVCQPQPGYPAGLPTSPGAMLTYLYRNSHGQNPPAVQAFITACDLISVSYLRPAALAALFGALEKLPGVSVADHAVNAAGQPGVAVQQTFHGMSYQLIFNPRTYAFFGGREMSVSASAGLKVSTILFSYAILKLAVVNHAGQLP